MKAENWLYHYRTTAGIEKTLRGLVRRARYIDDSEPAYRLFLLHYEELQACYDAFFPDVKQMAKEELDRVLTHF
jgi:acyl carrier protein phosphodiesterase